MTRILLSEEEKRKRKKRCNALWRSENKDRIALYFREWYANAKKHGGRKR